MGGDGNIWGGMSVQSDYGPGWVYLEQTDLCADAGETTNVVKSYPDPPANTYWSRKSDSFS